MTVLDAQAAAKLLYDEPAESPSRAPGGSPPTSKNLAFGDAARVVYGQPAPVQEAPSTRGGAGVSVYGDKASWNAEIAETYGEDLPVARELAARGLIADSPDPAAARHAIGEHGITPREFRRLMEIGAALRTGSR